MEILLTRGQVAQIDDKDFPSLNRHRWRAHWDKYTRSFYAVRRMKVGSKWTTHRMHREVLGLLPDDGQCVDHENHDTLDNRRENLRVTDHPGNGANRRDQSPFGAGVAQIPSGRYRSRVKVDGKYRYLGTFDTPSEAVQARVDALGLPGYTSRSRKRSPNRREDRGKPGSKSDRESSREDS